MSWFMSLILTVAVLAPPAPVAGGRGAARPVAPHCQFEGAPLGAPLGGPERELTPLRTLTCRYECICFRANGYRCLRTYTETCDGRACWQCQARVTRKAHLSCSIGPPIRSCFCKYQQR